MTENNTEPQREEPARPELVVGLIAPLGVDLDMLSAELRSAFTSVGYRSFPISLIDPVLEYEPWDKTPKAPFADRYNGRMDAGNQFREKLKRKDALAFLGVTAIERCRTANATAPAKENEPAPRIPAAAYLLRSLKTPEEVEALREIYGANFVAVAVYMPRTLRKAAMMRRIAESIGDPEIRRHEHEAAKLIGRDEFEMEEFGQNIRDTYPLADVFVDVSNQATTARETLRLVEIIFGHPSHTPRKGEAAMFHAYGARLRSSSAGRQVGAAIMTADGDVIAVGTNEVPKAHGGQYWADDAQGHDHRDHRRSGDSTSFMLSAIIHDFIARMKKAAWLSADKQAESIDRLYELAKAELLKGIPKARRGPLDPPTIADKALLERVIEYMRSVHAEMAALTTCARLGISVKGCEMYVTTFPCHECARLIVAAGIEGVYFIEPYPKSRVAEMYDDSIIVDDVSDEFHVSFRAFVGIAPRRFGSWFDAPEPKGRHPLAEVRRRNDDGTWVRWEHVKSSRWPRESDHPLAIVTREQRVLADFAAMVAKEGLNKPLKE